MKNYLLLSLFAFFVLFSCELNESELEGDLQARLSDTEETLSTLSTQDGDMPVDVCGEIITTTLWAGQNTEAGLVYFGNDEENLYVSVETSEGWYLQELHLFAGDWDDLPVNGDGENAGNPIFGQFPYKAEDLESGTTSYTFSIPLEEMTADDELSDDESICGYGVLHASVINDSDEDGDIDEDDESETAFAGNADNTYDREWDGNRWGGGLAYCLQACDENPDDDDEIYGCETSFAYAESGLCFSEFDISRWGWTIPMESDVDEMTLDLYGGAGQCDLSKGILTGHLYVNRIESGLSIKYEAAEDFEFMEVHFYAGTLEIPDNGNQVAPGQFPYKMEFDNGEIEHEFEFEIDAEETIYIIAHAVTCGNFPSDMISNDDDDGDSDDDDGDDDSDDGDTDDDDGDDDSDDGDTDDDNDEDDSDDDDDESDDDSDDD